jgi:hypothetical protein
MPDIGVFQSKVLGCPSPVGVYAEVVATAACPRVTATPPTPGTAGANSMGYLARMVLVGAARPSPRACRW